MNGKQITVLWHVDDLKISHVLYSVVTDLIMQIESVFGQEAPLTVRRGKVHDYLGMTLDYREKGKVKITMIDYITTMLSELPREMNGVAASPAASHLFKVNQTNPEKLDKERAELFYSNVMKLLFLCKRARPDIQTAIAFLTTRVKSPDSDDYKKLARVMRYLRGTRELPLTLEGSDEMMIKWWVDGAFAVHPDMRSHTGAIMSLGRGAVYAMSTRQKLNTRSSTEAELVGVDDAMSQILWTRYFMASQGYEVKESKVYQDNMSSMLLEKNGRASCSKRTRHINIRYFFVTDRIASKEIHVEYCPTEEMVADFFTKPLQGSLFRKFRNWILNMDDAPLADRLRDHRSVLGIQVVPNGGNPDVDVENGQDAATLTSRDE